MLLCADGRYYVGTHKGEDPRTREAAHNEGRDRKAFTYPRRPVRLVWAEPFDQPAEASAAARLLKGWTRERKDALVRGDFDEVKRVAALTTGGPTG